MKRSMLDLRLCCFLAPPSRDFRYCIRQWYSIGDVLEVELACIFGLMIHVDSTKEQDSTTRQPNEFWCRKSSLDFDFKFKKSPKIDRNLNYNEEASEIVQRVRGLARTTDEVILGKD
mmetsp:Transcript_13679/g.33114  ORF Transcript_13679/g.33114 Transcript_13679/m.33114 type:complete len:117 (-) Transcript_13679:127-477(-)